MSKSRVNFVDTATVLSSHSPESSIVKCRTNKLGAVMLTLMGILFGLSLIYLISRMIKISKNISSIEYFMGNKETIVPSAPDEPPQQLQPRPPVMVMHNPMHSRLRPIIPPRAVPDTKKENDDKEKKQPVNIRREADAPKKQEDVKMEQKKEEKEEESSAEEVKDVDDGGEEGVEEVEENTQESDTGKKEVSFDVHILHGSGGDPLACIIASASEDVVDGLKHAPKKRGRPPKSLPLVLEA